MQDLLVISVGMFSLSWQEQCCISSVKYIKSSRCRWTTASCSRNLILLNAANRRLCYSCCFCCSATVCLRFLPPYFVLLCVSSPHSRPSILPPSSSSIQNNFFPSHRPHTLATARQCLHLTSLLFLVPDVLRCVVNLTVDFSC